MADVPESVSRSIRIASEATRKRLYPAASISRWRSSRVVVRMGSTLLMRNGSIIGRLGMRKVESPCRHYHNLGDPFGETNGCGRALYRNFLRLPHENYFFRERI